MDIREYLFNAGLQKGDNIIVHSSLRALKRAFPGLTIDSFIKNLQETITPEGSLVFPAFTYCFKKRNGESEVFNREFSPSKTGSVSDYFRTLPGVVRTSSPTHSFAIWGSLCDFISYDNSPESPLGYGSVLDLLAKTPRSFVFMAGTDFTSFSLGHYIEVIANVPWKDFSPWSYLEVEESGISVDGVTRLKEIPGCSKQFIQFENYLINNKFIKQDVINNNKFSVTPVDFLITHGLRYFSENHEKLLCPYGSCKACDARRHYLESIKR
jgi:aminoglycoside 3-N-acetyltransferase